MKELINRLQAETPVFFKKIIWMGITLASAGAGIEAYAKTGHYVPANLVNIANNLILIGIVAASISKTAKVDAPAQEVTTPNGSTPGNSTLPVLLLIALGCCLLTGCANRKVAINKTTDVFSKTASSKLVDTSKNSYSSAITLQQYFGDTLRGSLFFADPTNTHPADSTNNVAPVTGATEAVDSLESGGIKIKVGLLPVLGGYKAHIIAVSKPIETQTTQVNTGQTALGVTLTTDSSSKGKVTGTVKTTTSTGRALPGAIIVVLLFVLAAAIFIIYKLKFENE